MEKIALSNFMLEEPKTTEITINETTFIIYNDIPYEELLAHIQWAILLIVDDKGYISNPIKQTVQELVAVAAFTNIDFSKLELATITHSELYEMYDIIKKTGILKAVYENVCTDQLKFYDETLTKTLYSITDYRNSVAGIVELLSTQNTEMKERFQTVLDEFQDEEKVGNILKIAEAMGEIKQSPAE
jgi:hypothetical protein